MKTVLYKPNDFRERCLGCGLHSPDTKEHVYPVWLLKETKTWNYPIGWISGKKIPGKNCVFPICNDCNQIFNDMLEGPFHKIFKKIKEKGSINDYEAEIVIRWMWKTTQLFYMISQKRENVAWSTNVREKSTSPIERPRSRISLALALTKDNIENKAGAEPLGLDVLPKYSVVLSAGVFSNISIITFYSKYRNLIPNEYDVHTLLSESNKDQEMEIIINHSFSDSFSAIDTTIKVANKLLPLHEKDCLDFGAAIGINPFVGDPYKIIS